MTNGVVDPPGKHYSLQYWKGRVKRGTGSGLGRTVKIGVTDYEFFGQKPSDRKHCNRRVGHRHFFAQGSPAAVAIVADIFRLAVPSILWRESNPSREVPTSTTNYSYYNHYYFYCDSSNNNNNK